MAESAANGPPAAKRQRTTSKAFAGLEKNIKSYLNGRPDVSVYLVTVKGSEKRSPSTSMSHIKRVG